MSSLLIPRGLLNKFWVDVTQFFFNCPIVTFKMQISKCSKLVYTNETLWIRMSLQKFNNFSRKSLLSSEYHNINLVSRKIKIAIDFVIDINSCRYRLQEMTQWVLIVTTFFQKFFFFFCWSVKSCRFADSESWLV